MRRCNRRDFIAVSANVLVASALLPTPRRRADADLVLRNGTVFDGSGTEGRVLDVAISGGRIGEIGPSLAAKGREEYDAKGLAIAPGFIDIHSHGDGNLSEDPRAESVIRQGVTTIVVGCDGSSSATGSSVRPFHSYFTQLARVRPGPNVACMVGLGSVRGEVVGEDDRPATANELRRMTAMVESALADGACGASSGLEYTPGAFASLAELIALCTPLARRRLPYATHMRNEDDRLLEAVDESLAVARGAGCALEISHLKAQGPRNFAKIDAVFQRVADARAAGVPAAWDWYPYVAYSTGLTNLFPVWSRDGGTPAFLARLDDPSVAPRIRREALAKVELIGGWDNVQISSVRAAEDRNAEGKRLGAHARALGIDPYDDALGLLRRSGANVGMLGFAMNEETLEKILAHPLTTICSDGGGFAVDGPTRRGSPHPRGAGTFPRVLGHYVRERKVIPLADAIRKMTSLSAARVGLRDRGTLAAGFAADVVVFDPARIADRATFDNPFQYPAGIAAVIVNGAFALRQGERAAVGTGTPLRAS
ncbi:MAG: D-aminoacylase [Gemmatimonadota bacterium]|nr:D-aminoacylase [Gemmatimonadota bacterium]